MSRAALRDRTRRMVVFTLRENGKDNNARLAEFINHCLEVKYGVDSMRKTGENVAKNFPISRQDQDLFALRSQQRAVEAIPETDESTQGKIAAVPIQQRRATRPFRRRCASPADTTLEALSKLKTVVKPTGTITAGNCLGVNDGLWLASGLRGALKRHDWTPRARALLRPRMVSLPESWAWVPVPADANQSFMAKAGLSSGTRTSWN